MKNKIFYACILILCFTFNTGYAGSFSVDPVILNLNSQQLSGTFKITNLTGQPTVIQLSIQRWTQKDMQENYFDIPNFIVTPPIVRLPANGTQLIRVGFLTPPTSYQQELTYRLFLQEVPPPPSPGFNGLQIAVRVSIPIFISPSTLPGQQLTWQAQWIKNNTLELRVINTGNVHTKFLNLTLSNPDNNKIWQNEAVFNYVLAGQYYIWTLKGKETYPQNLSTIKLTALTDNGTQTFIVPIK